MNRAFKIALFIGLAVALSVGNVFAGRGGGGHGGGGHGGGHSSSHHSHESHNHDHKSHHESGYHHDHEYHHETGYHHDDHGYHHYHPGWHHHDWHHHDYYHHDWYHGNWHEHWDHAWHGWPYGWVGAGWGLSASAPWSWGYCNYENPYYTTPIVVGSTTIDYSQPIASGAAPAKPADQASDRSLSTDEGNRLLDTARQSFLQGDYSAALSSVDKAIAKQPGDLAAYEFRGLICFANKQYKEAAAAIYTVLSAGPGWNWTTLCDFYSDLDIYTKQLRALEQYVKANPKAGDARFLLAYQYLTCGYNDAAAKQLKEVAQLNPKDRLAAQLAASLTPAEEKQPPAKPASAKPAKPVDAAGLVGDWKAQQPDDSSIALKLTDDSKYTWQYNRQGKMQTHQGTYVLNDDLLTFKEGGKPAIVGEISKVGDGLNFKLANDNPNDPGLTFSK